MTLPALPEPPAQYQPAPSPPSVYQPINQPPVTAPEIAPSVSSSDLSSVSNSQQNNSNVNNTRVSNINVNNQNLQGSDVSVGNIRYQRASAYFNFSYNPGYGESILSGGIIIPVGGGATIARAAKSIAHSNELSNRGQLCVSVRKNEMTLDEVEAAFGDDAKWLQKCIALRPVNANQPAAVTPVPAPLHDYDRYEDELRRLRAEIEALRAKPQQQAAQEAIKGLW